MTTNQVDVDRIKTIRTQLPAFAIEGVRKVVYNLAKEVCNPLPIWVVRESFELSVGRSSTENDIDSIVACLSILALDHDLLEAVITKRGGCVRYKGLPDVDNIAKFQEKDLPTHHFDNNLSVN